MARLGLLVLASLFFAPPFGPLPKGKPKPKVIQPKPLPKPAKPQCGDYYVAIPVQSNLKFHPDGNNSRSVDVGGKHTLEVEAKADHTDTRLFIQLSAKVRNNDGFSRYAVHSNFFVNAKVPKGCRIESIKESTAKGTLSHTRDSHNFRTAYGKGLVDEATCRTDTNSNDIGRLSCTRVKLKSVWVRTTSAQSECSPLRKSRAVTLPVHTHRGGDKEMGGNEVELSVDGRYRQVGQRIFLDTKVKMREAEPDHTTFEGSRTDLVLDVAVDYPTCKIKKVDTREPRLRAVARPHHSPRFFNPQNNRAIVENNMSSATCRTDSDGKDGGQLSCSSVRYGSPSIQLERR